MFVHYLPDPENEKLVPGSIATAFKNAECPSKYSIISTEKGNDNHDYDHPNSVWEKEETDDEDETSDIHNQPVSLSGCCGENTFVDLLRLSRKVTQVPLFILLHSWKHFLN